MSAARTFAIAPSDAFHLDVANDHVGCIWMLDAPLASGAIEDAVERLVSADLRMTAAYDSAAACWRPQHDFDLARQIVLGLPVADISEMLARLADHYVEPLLDQRPPWRVIYLPWADGSGAALLFLAHHAFTDGFRGLQLIRALGKGRVVLRPGISEKGGYTLSALVGAIAQSVRDMTRGEAGAVPKQADGGRRCFALGQIPADRLRVAVRTTGLDRSDLLAAAFAEAIGDRFGSSLVRLMIPRNVGNGGVGNAFLPEIRNFRRGARGMREEAGPEADLARRAAADRLRMALMRWMPAAVRDLGYRRWANGFDALCTILPDLSPGQRIGDARVSAIFGVPPLIWRQPLACAMLLSRSGATLMLAWDPAAIDDPDLVSRTIRIVESKA